MKVWAYSGIKSNFMSTTEWQDSFRFDSLPHLVEVLRQHELQHKVDVLAIVAHGDTPGFVALDPPLESVSAAKIELVRLRNFLKSDGRLMFVACQVAGGTKGDEFLCQISTILAGVEIVGFIVANEAFGGFAGGYKIFSQNSTRNDEWSEQAKWAFNGSIIRSPLFEVLSLQSQDPLHKNRCGSNNCMGHDTQSLKSMCYPYKRTSWPKWATQM